MRFRLTSGAPTTDGVGFVPAPTLGVPTPRATLGQEGVRFIEALGDGGAPLAPSSIARAGPERGAAFITVGRIKTSSARALSEAEGTLRPASA